MTDERLYEHVPKSLIPAVVVTALILLILFFDIQSGVSTNPVIFYALPFLYLITFMTIETIPIILKTLGFYFPTLWSKIVAIISIPIGLIIGSSLVALSKARASIFPISTYPWVLSSFADVEKVSFLATLTPSTAGLLFLVVAFFEEGTALYLGKNLANYLYDKGLSSIPACLVGLILGRIVLTSHHWFSYQGFSQPYLYIVALALFSIFTIIGIFFSLIAGNYIFGKEKFSGIKVISVMMPVMIALHLGFDYAMANLMIFVP